VIFFSIIYLQKIRKIFKKMHTEAKFFQNFFDVKQMQANFLKWKANSLQN